MRHVLIIMFVILFSLPSFAGSYRKRVRKEYYRRSVVQKYRHQYNMRESRLQGRLAMQRAKRNQRIRGRYRSSRNYYPVAYAIR